MDIVNLYDNYNSYFNEDLKAIFEQSSKIASENNFKLYLIGGLVRDLLLNVKSLDIDITVEGNAIEFAKILKSNCNAEILSLHEKFGTAKIKFFNQKIDLASTRSEIYPRAGHLPVVTKIGCALKEDVLRRDFTANALALSLNKENFCELIDFTNGFKDLKNKKLRILHDKSFIDDPTRIIRGLKYASRLNFELEEQTLKLQEDYLENVNHDMCYKRLKQEFVKTFNNTFETTFEAFINQGIYKLFTIEKITKPNINPDKLILKYRPKHVWLVWFGVLFINNNLTRFAFSKYEKEALEGAKSLLNKSFSSDFEIYKAFCACKIETLLILAALGKEKEVLKFLDNLQNITLKIKGNDLINIGFKPSKEFGEIFDEILKAKIKTPEKFKTKDEELKFAQKFIKNPKN